jgi:CDP-diacylglycerol---glycerol-3-phosphate 3-phosphatidyltransferase
MFVIVWLTLQSWCGAASLALLVFVAAAVSDWLDGVIARKRGLVSNFGKFMDALTDKILIIGLMVGFVERFDLPLPFVLVTLCREFLVSGMRMVVAAKGVVVAADSGGKTKTVLQMIAIGCLLASSVVGNDVTVMVNTDLSWLAGHLHTAGLIGFVLGTYLAVWSGYRYMRTNWVAFSS